MNRNMVKMVRCIFVCMLFVTSIFTGLTIAKNIVHNKQSINDVITNSEYVLDVRVEVEEKGYREYEISVYIINTLDEELLITTEYNEPLDRIDIYKSDYYSHNKYVYNSCGELCFGIKFEPHEEKLMRIATWNGMANYPLWIIEGGPIIVPEGDYSVQGVVTWYKYNGNQGHAQPSDPMTISLPEPKSKAVKFPVFNNILVKLLDKFPLLQQLFKF